MGGCSQYVLHILFFSYVQLASRSGPREGCASPMSLKHWHPSHGCKHIMNVHSYRGTLALLSGGNPRLTVLGGSVQGWLHCCEP